jgi:tagaturonate reductase
VLTEDVEPFRLRKVRLLNGSHSLLAPVGLLCGLSTVGESVKDPDVGNYLRRVMFDEILPACDAPDAAAFASDVLERFANPYIAHSLTDITLHATAKMRVRVVPTIMDYSRQEGRVPDLTCFGFAAFLLFRSRDENGASKLPADESAVVIRDAWLNAGASADNVTEFVKAICEERSLWQMDLCDVRGFADMVSAHLSSMLREGVRPSLRRLIARTPATPAVSEAS